MFDEQMTKKQIKGKEYVLKTVDKLFKAGYLHDDIIQIMISVIAEVIYQKKIDNILSRLSQDNFWEEYAKQTGTDISLEAILKRNGVYSNEKLKEAQEISSRRRLHKGKNHYLKKNK